jgi:hypothetical protein
VALFLWLFQFFLPVPSAAVPDVIAFTHA